MNVQVVMDGMAYTVEVESEKVTIKGRTYGVKEKGSTIEVDGTPYVVEIKNGEVLVNGISHTFRVESQAGKTSEKKVSSAPGAVVVMMPGKIINVLVKEGDTVKGGDVVCILEAMKMENELRAPKDGMVKKVHVQSGANVEKGDILVEIG